MTMSEEARRRDRLVVLTMVGLVLFNPPLLGLFGQSERTLFGWPLLYVYVFAVWAALIAAVAWTVERRGRRRGRKPGLGSGSGAGMSDVP